MEKEGKVPPIRIEECLNDSDIEINIVPLNSLKAFIVRSFSGRLRLAVSDKLAIDDKNEIYLQTLAHVVLGHIDRPLACILIRGEQPLRMPLTDDEVLWEEHAKDLGKAMVSGTVKKLWERPDFQILYSAKRVEAQVVSDQLRNK